MSRIGKLPVNLPKGVTVNVNSDNVVSVKGPLGELSQAVDRDLKVEVVGNEIHLTRPSDSKNHKSLHGLYRALLFRFQNISSYRKYSLDTISGRAHTDIRS